MTEAERDNREIEQSVKVEGELELRVWNANDEQLAAGLAAAREVLESRGVTAGRAVVCHSAVAAHELDPSLPAPGADVRAAAEACREAFVAAISAAGGTLDSEDALAFEQRPADAALWDTLPTLRAWRDKNNAHAVSRG
ncbi:hypothetical protein [Scleromatobacter humisilvae]|uniref:Uncharacterized protein n=1 Tax=Scleromatobacter humisilvae TaxID=2897159 RepID=A0A9X1YE90_9BURK|nr:hypothetical protein [Scleromatobacter humisilvae]MCK9684383.1 hypothetical protein [Scleromatobacter humisilvae]